MHILRLCIKFILFVNNGVFIVHHVILTFCYVILILSEYCSIKLFVELANKSDKIDQENPIYLILTNSARGGGSSSLTVWFMTLCGWSLTKTG